jgi:uncharacterized protein (TIGR02145 family)
LFTTPVPAVTNSPLSKTLCSGDTTKILLTSSVPGTFFHWTPLLTSGNVAGFAPDSGHMINQVLTNNSGTPGVVTYTITPNVGNCTGLPVPFPVTVYGKDTSGISITPSGNSLCTGTQVTYTALPKNPGLVPVYQWLVNGIPAGTNSPVFTYTPLNGDQVKCVMLSSIAACILNNPATSNTITMIVTPYQPVSISISTPSDTVCAGTQVTFNAFASHGGTSPVFLWKINGIPAGTNNSTFSCIPVNGDVITCTLTSSESCTTGSPATSAPITMTVNANQVASLTISASPNPFCPGNPVTLTAHPVNGGPTPAFQWWVNNVMAGSNSLVYVYTPALNDSVKCVMTSSYACISVNPVVSNNLILGNSLAPVVSFIPCFDTITTLNAKPIKLKGGLPLNGIYSGPGVNPVTSTFLASAAGTGIKTITYTYTNAATCSAGKTLNIHVLPLPVFTCGNNLTDIRDNKSYPTIQIGGQCWIAANLNYGTLLPSATHQRDNCVAEKYCLNDLSANCGPVSVYYQWDELMCYDDTPGSQGLCPPGWHVPAEAEWNILFSNWTTNAFAGAPLKYTGFSGFTALLQGARHENIRWDFPGFATFFWSSTSHGNLKAWSHGMNEADFGVSLYPSLRSNGFSVRCLKD